MQNFSVCPDAKASPFGRGVTAGDGEGKLSATEPPHGDRQPLFVRAKLSRRLQFFGSVLALSGASRQLSQRESHYTLLASSSTLRFGTQ